MPRNIKSHSKNLRVSGFTGVRLPEVWSDTLLAAQPAGPPELHPWLISCVSMGPGAPAHPASVASLGREKRGSGFSSGQLLGGPSQVRDLGARPRR